MSFVSLSVARLETLLDYDVMHRGGPGYGLLRRLSLEPVYRAEVLNLRREGFKEMAEYYAAAWKETRGRTK